MSGRGSAAPGPAGDDGVVAVRRAEAESELVTAVGFGVDEGAALPEEPVVAAPRELGDIPDGDVVIASGESLTGQWRIVADAQRQANVGSLTIERMLGTIGSTASTTDDRAGPPLDLGADISDGTVVL